MSLAPGEDPPPTDTAAASGKRNETAVRIVMAVVMIGLLALGLYADVHWLPGWHLPATTCFHVIVLVLSVLAVREFYAMMRAAGLRPFGQVGISAVVLLVLATAINLINLNDLFCCPPFFR